MGSWDGRFRINTRPFFWNDVGSRIQVLRNFKAYFRNSFDVSFFSGLGFD